MSYKKYTLMLLLLLGCVLIVLSGCRDADLDPIYYTLENEEEIVDRGLDNEISVTHVVTGGSDYYAAAGVIHKRPVAGGDWTKIATPADSLCTALAVHNGELYAGFVNRSNGAGLGLWKTAFPAISWTQLSDFATSAEVVMLKEANSLLFVSTLESLKGKLYTYSLAGVYQGASTLPDAAGEPFSYDQVFVRDVAYDGSDYWLVAATYLLTGGAGSFTVAATAGQPSGVEFWGLHYAAGGAGNLPAGLYVSTYDASESDGRIAHYDVTWTSSAAVSTTFTEFLAAANDRLWVGTQDSGYYDLTSSTDVATLFADIADQRQPDNTIADLYNGSVLRFAQDGGTIFACTSLAGLWTTNNLGADWDRE